MKKKYKILKYIIVAAIILAPVGYLVQAADENTSISLTSWSTYLSFITKDKKSPYVYIISPFSGQRVSGVIILRASATDRSGIAYVQFLVDGADFGAADTLSPYSISADTTQLTNGTHKISARAADKAGNVGISPTVSVNVSNNYVPPPPLPTPPSAPLCPTSPAFGASPNPIESGQIGRAHV